MERVEINVMLKVREKSANTPAVQIQKFEETMEAGSCEKVEVHDAPGEQEVGTSHQSVWERTFKAGKKPKQMLKTSCNLLERAGEYSDVVKLVAELSIEGHPTETFTWGSAKSSDFFKTKSWK